MAHQTPPTMRWCVGEAGALYEQTLIAMRGVLDAADEQHWLAWIDHDIRDWRVDGSTRHHRTAYGGMGSLSDVYLFGRQDEPQRIWLDAALGTLRHLASSAAVSAEHSPSTLKQISPHSSGLGGLGIYVCTNCGGRFVLTESRIVAAAAGWSSAVVPELVQAGRGEDVASRCLGLAESDDRQQYIDAVDGVIDADLLQPAKCDRYEDWRCPTCNQHRWRSSSVAVF